MKSVSFNHRRRQVVVWGKSKTKPNGRVAIYGPATIERLTPVTRPPSPPPSLSHPSLVYPPFLFVVVEAVT